MGLPIIGAVFRADTNNVGDLYSSPCRYFQFHGYEVRNYDILRDIDKVVKEKVDVLILGGGGLLNNYFKGSVKRLKELTGARLLVAWGVGQHEDQHNWQLNYKTFQYGEYLGGFTCIGIRDYGFEYQWVPCASCMHPIFDVEKEPVQEYVVFEHKNFKIPVNGVPRLTNHGISFEEVIDFLASGETIITSSYHGAYWATLLRRKVIVFPFASKFYTLRYPVTIYPAIWKKGKTTSLLSALWRRGGRVGEKLCVNFGFWNKIGVYAKTYPDALNECRMANRKFYESVLELLT